MIQSLIYSPHLVDLYNRSSPAPIEPHTNQIAYGGKIDRENKSDL
jgi:hypothetical protein